MYTFSLRAALQYATQWGWPIARGHAAVDRSESLCTCDDAACAAPGFHPVAVAWRAEATTDDTNRLATLWADRSWWPIAPTGIRFDAIKVDGPVSTAVLRRRGTSVLPACAGRAPIAPPR
jgi:hypothetical protein